MPKTTSPCFHIPDKIASAVQKLQKAVEDLADIAGHKQKKFTLDGRLVGDIGEVIAASLFDIKLTENQKTGFDAKIASGPNKGHRVEVKCRRKSKNIDFKEIPAHLVVLFVKDGDHVAELVYAGSGSVLTDIRLDAQPDQKGKLQKKITVSLAMLRSRFRWSEFSKNPSIPLRPTTKPLP